MRIALIDQSLSGHRVEYANYICKYLNSRGDDVLYLNTEDNERLSNLRSICNQVEIIEPPFFNNVDNPGLRIPPYIKYFQKCFQAADEWGADAVHHLFFDQTEIAHFCLSLRSNSQRLPFYATLFNPVYSSSSESFFTQFFRRSNLAATLHLLQSNYLGGLFVHTENIRTQLTSAGLPEDKVHVVPDPIDPIEEDLTRKEARSELGLKTRGMVFLYFGRLRKDKGADIFLNLVANRNGPETYALAGSPGYITAEDVRETKKCLDSGVKLISRLEFIPDELINLYFLAADAIILPYRSEYSGTSGILQRGIAAKRPIIGTDVGEVGTIISDEGVGIVVEPDSPESISKAVDSLKFNYSEIAQTAADNAEDYILNHHWKEFARKVRDVYVSV